MTSCPYDNWPNVEQPKVVVLPKLQEIADRYYSPVCRKCGTPMKPGKAIQQTTVAGVQDFPSAEVVTMSAGGPGKLIDCLKCPQCGWSVTQ